MATYTEEHFDVNGIDTAVLTAGYGPPLVFFHGAGTLTGFDSLLPLADSFHLIVPNHPGFGASADDPSVDSIEDYVRHYLDLFDLIGLEEFSLAGHSMGGYLAATFAISQAPRINRLVLCAPLGLRVREHPTVDIFAVRDEDLLPMLTEDMSVFAGKIPDPPGPEFFAERYREMTSAARIFWRRVYDIKLAKWLHRLTMPTMLLWGDSDRVIPPEQAPIWAQGIPNAEIRLLPGVGHLLFDESREAVDAVGEFAAQAVKV